MGNSLIGKKMSFSDFIKLCENDNDVNLTHFMVVTSNRILCEYCMPPYEMDSLKLLFSITKSFTSLAIGIAYDMQLLSLTDRVMDFFPDESPPTPCSNLQGIQIQHLLTMSSGIHANTYDLLFPQDNWIKAFLAQDFPHEPGEFYRYSTHASHMPVSYTHLDVYKRQALGFSVLRLSHACGIAVAFAAAGGLFFFSIFLSEQWQNEHLPFSYIRILSRSRQWPQAWHIL